MNDINNNSNHPLLIKYHNTTLQMKRIIYGCITIILIALALTGCNNETSKEFNTAPYISKSSFLLNTIVTIHIYDIQDEKLLDQCFDLITEFERIFSRTQVSSELYALNHGTAPRVNDSYKISDELAALLQYGLYYSRLSGGAFDITIAPVTTLWNFTSINPVVPLEEDVVNALTYVDFKNIKLNDNEISFMKEGVSIDLGAIAKGYIADKVKELLIANGVKNAMINLGGNVLCIGEKPNGSPFKVGIQKPYADRNETIAVMEISDLSVVSSGIYERFFILDEISYHHILNPITGHPYDNDLVSVTILSKLSVDGDGLSTTCFALGQEKGLALINSLPNIHAVFITKDYKIHYSEGFHDSINIIE